MASIFTKIINGEIPCYKIAENEQFIAFLDVFPVVKGHVLVIPKQEIDYIFDVPDETLAQMLVFAKPIAKAIQKVVSCKRVGLSVIGLEVPHAHLHLVPLNQLSDMDFTEKLTPPPSADEFSDLAKAIKSHL
jgi:histidine triad (HIT) family protein